MHSKAFEKHALSSEVFLLTEIPETKTSAPPVKKTYLNTTSFFSYDSADKKETSAASAMARAQRVLRAVQSTLV